MNKQKLILYFFATAMTSELSKYLNKKLGIFYSEITKMILAKNKNFFV